MEHGSRCSVGGLVLAAAIGAGPALAGVQPECVGLTEGGRLSIAVPNGPGGGYDTYARALAPVIAGLTGATVRVENLPAAGGLAAYRRLIEARDSDWVIMVEEADDVVRGMEGLGLSPGNPGGYRIAAVFHNEPGAWVVRKGFDPLNPPGGVLVAASSSKDDADEWLLAGLGLGLEWKLIDGYDGSSAMNLALLGKDVDVLTTSLGSSLRSVKSGDLAIAAVLTDGPHPDLPGVPYLVGPGSLGEARLATLTGEARTEAETHLRMLQRMTTVLRSVVVQGGLAPDRAACLDAAINAAVNDPAFRAAAEAEGRDVSPLPLAEALSMIGALTEGIAQVKILREAGQ